MSTTDLERETDAARDRISGLLDELRGRISPGQVVDQFIEAAGDGAGSSFAHKLGRQMRSNPLACMLAAAGAAWLMMSDRRVHVDGGGRSDDRTSRDRGTATPHQSAEFVAVPTASAAAGSGDGSGVLDERLQRAAASGGRRRPPPAPGLISTHFEK